MYVCTVYSEALDAKLMHKNKNITSKSKPRGHLALSNRSARHAQLARGMTQQPMRSRVSTLTLTLPLSFVLCEL